MQEHTGSLIRDGHPRIYSRELIDVLFQRPYCRIENLVNAGVAERQTASKYLNILAASGILIARKVGREKVFILPAFLSVVTSES